MESERWQRLSRTFDEICDLPPELRGSRLAEIALDAPDLVDELRSMLAADGTRGGVIAAGAAVFVAGMTGEPPPATPGPLAGGSRLGPYEIESLLGAGGMGEVYRARDTRLDRAVAIKVIAASRATSEEMRQRFQREARAVSQLQHSHICALYDVGSQDGIDYLVMELLDGESLAARLKRGALSLDLLLRCGREVAEALDYAHRQGIVHRDLKPANVLLTRAGAKLLDFGIARIRPAGALTSARSALTVEGALLGTVQYMAPEQLEGRESDARTDLFALGVLLYEMATGRPPFEADSQASLIAAILTTQPEPITTFQKVAPVALDRLVRTCLAKDPEERWQSAHDVGAQLGWIAESGSQAATAPPLAPARSLRFRLRKLWPVALAAAAATAVWIAAELGAFGGAASLPVFRQQTFRRGVVTGARFAADGQTILYSARWDNQPVELYSTRRGNTEARSLGIGSARLLAFSRAGEMALLLRGGGPHTPGTLARVPLAGGTPRELLAAVIDADWTASGEELAVVRYTPTRELLELPIGHVIHEARRIWSPRVSRRGDRVAFFAGSGSGLGDLMLADRSGQVRPILTGWKAYGLSWSPADDEIWFTGARGDATPALNAVSLSGRVRLLARAPDPLYLHDLFADGVALVTRDQTKQHLVCRAPGAEEETELGWLGHSWLEDLSADGRAVLFSERGAGGGSLAAAYLRPTDGSPALRLGDGLAQGLSPDGSRALVLNREGSELAVLPTGAGTRRDLPRGPLEAVQRGDWLDDRRIIFQGNERGREPRVYLQDVEDGTIRPLTPEGTELGLNAPLPDARSVQASLRDVPLLYSTDGGEPSPIPFLEPQSDWPLQWSPDRRHLYLRRRSSRPPVEIQRLDTFTGERRSWLTLHPRDAVGVQRLQPILLSADGQSYCYSYSQELGDLFLVEGLR